MLSDLSELDGYPYCGHSALLGIRKRAWQETQYISAFFGKRLQDARRAYRGFVEKGIAMAELARRLGLTLAAVSYAVNRGEKTARETGWRLGE